MSGSKIGNISDLLVIKLTPLWETNRLTIARLEGERCSTTKC